MDLTLTLDEVDILIMECKDEIKKLNKVIRSGYIQRDMLRRKKRRWIEEKEQLELIRSGANFSEPLVKVPQKTIQFLKHKFHKCMAQYHRMMSKNPP